MSKIIEITPDYIKFDCGTSLQISKESFDGFDIDKHWLDFMAIDIKDCEELEFDLTNDNFFNKVLDYGIELIPTNGHPLRIAGYGYQFDAYYTDDIAFSLENTHFKKLYNIYKCEKDLST